MSLAKQKKGAVLVAEYWALIIFLFAIKPMDILKEENVVEE